MAEALLVAVGKGSQADVGPKPVTEDRCAVLRAPVFGAARAGMVAVRMRYEVDLGQRKSPHHGGVLPQARCRDLRLDVIFSLRTKTEATGRFGEVTAVVSGVGELS